MEGKNKSIDSIESDLEENDNTLLKKIQIN